MLILKSAILHAFARMKQFVFEAKPLSMNVLTVNRGGYRSLVKVNDMNRLGGYAAKPVLCVYSPMLEKNSSWA